METRLQPRTFSKRSPGSRLPPYPRAASPDSHVRFVRRAPMEQRQCVLEMISVLLLGVARLTRKICQIDCIIANGLSRNVLPTCGQDFSFLSCSPRSRSLSSFLRCSPALPNRARLPCFPGQSAVSTTETRGNPVAPRGERFFDDKRPGIVENHQQCLGIYVF